MISGPDALLSSENPETRRLGMRAANLGVLNWAIWSQGRGRSLVDELEEPTSRCLVVDLGSRTPSTSSGSSRNRAVDAVA